MKNIHSQVAYSMALLLAAVIFLLAPGCTNSRDDPAADDDLADDDAMPDDDASDDDAADDDGADDDAAVDDDALDDDAIDDDTVEDAPICEDGSAVFGDACEAAMWRIYCSHRMPVIFEGRWYSQSEAVEACHEGASPVWGDLVDCAGQTWELAVCLENRGWPPELPEIFDVEHWEPVEDVGWAAHQALNFFFYWMMEGPRESFYIGGIIYPDQPLLRLNVFAENVGVTYGHLSLLTGTSTHYSEKRIDFRVSGVHMCYGEGCEQFLQGVSATITFEPIE